MLRTLSINIIAILPVEELEDVEEMDTEFSAPESSQALREMFSQEDKQMREIDFSAVRKKETKTSQDYDRQNERYIHRLQEVTNEMDKIAPNLRALEKYDSIRQNLTEITAQFEESRQLAKEASESFEQLKKSRVTRFMEAFTKISDSIDPIYKQLTNSNGSRAYLSLENPNEPFLGGIKFNAIPPNKRFRDMEQLSGGEKTVAALALLFAIHSYQPSPFFILDEIDAALDSSNVNNVAHYIKRHSKTLQFIVISLKESFFENADALIGIFKDRPQNSSKAIMLDLMPYEF